MTKEEVIFNTAQKLGAALILARPVENFTKDYKILLFDCLITTLATDMEFNDFGESAEEAIKRQFQEEMEFAFKSYFEEARKGEWRK